MMETQTNGAGRTTTALATRDEGFELASFHEAEQRAQVLAKSTLLPPDLRNKPADVLVVMVTGHELGLKPMQAIRGIHVIKGRPVLSADLMVALVKRSPECMFFRMVASSPKEATYETQRRGDPEATRMTWTIEQAQTAGLMGNDNWKRHPDAMLRARCSSALARAVYPDLVGGMYDEDEGREIAGERPARRTATVTHYQGQAPTRADDTAVDAEIVETQHDPDTGEVMEGDPGKPTDDERIAGWVDLIAKAETPAALAAIGKQLNEQEPADGAVRAAVKPHYSRRQSELRKA